MSGEAKIEGPLANYTEERARREQEMEVEVEGTTERKTAAMKIAMDIFRQRQKKKTDKKKERKEGSWRQQTGTLWKISLLNYRHNLGYSQSLFSDWQWSGEWAGREAGSGGGEPLVGAREDPGAVAQKNTAADENQQA